MPGNKEHQEICVVGRLFSLEALVVIMGVVSLIYGLATGKVISVIIGAAVLAAIWVLARWCRRNQAKQQ
ncbi:hypothetical protein GMST_05440 [Geomonas silvestris]|uniref:Uncharacterized protein n=1 Tax=Geomonas silvestris TaxID=2740184 RepID=A0A6V8MF01_9BACT|nr:hypothetical protein [Geomonas silvestris]GFO58219.1 hypothetical protein GMST_05440 [Geomonas silvestris]